MKKRVLALLLASLFVVSSFIAVNMLPKEHVHAGDGDDVTSWTLSNDFSGSTTVGNFELRAYDAATKQTKLDLTKNTSSNRDWSYKTSATHVDVNGEFRSESYQGGKYTSGFPYQDTVPVIVFNAPSAGVYDLSAVLSKLYARSQGKYIRVNVSVVHGGNVVSTVTVGEKDNDEKTINCSVTVTDSNKEIWLVFERHADDVSNATGPWQTYVESLVITKVNAFVMSEDFSTGLTNGQFTLKARDMKTGEFATLSSKTPTDSLTWRYATGACDADEFRYLVDDGYKYAGLQITPNQKYAAVVSFKAPQDGVYEYSFDLMKEWSGAIGGLIVNVGCYVQKGNSIISYTKAASNNFLKNITGKVELKAGEELLFVVERETVSWQNYGHYMTLLKNLKVTRLKDLGAQNLATASGYVAGNFTSTVNGNFKLLGYNTNTKKFFDLTLQDDGKFTFEDNGETVNPFKLVTTNDAAATFYNKGSVVMGIGNGVSQDKVHAAVIEFTPPADGYYQYSMLLTKYYDGNGAATLDSIEDYYVVKNSGSALTTYTSYKGNLFREHERVVLSGLVYLKTTDKLYFMNKQNENANNVGNFGGVVNLLSVTPVNHDCQVTDIESIPLKNATCVVDGVEAHYECKVCHKYFTDANGENYIAPDSITIAAPGQHTTPDRYYSNGLEHWMECASPYCNDDIPGTRGEHSGGSANCEEGKKCEICDLEYTDIDPEIHKDAAEYVKDEDSHSLDYSCCDTDDIADEPHEWNGDNECDECKYVCENHAGGTAYCDTYKKCQYCGTEYGEKDSDNHRGEAEYTSNENTHSVNYPCCDAEDVADQAHVDDDSDEVCDVCGYGCDHTGGSATCSSKAVCDNCGHDYGSLDPDAHIGVGEWKYDADSHYFDYDCCDAKDTDEAEHSFKNGSCEDCGYICVHSGGEATCLNGKICEHCGLEYTEADETAHIGGEATCSLRAQCERCFARYGALDPDNHTQGVGRVYNLSHHYDAYICCHAEKTNEEPHNYVNDRCHCGKRRYSPNTYDSGVSVAVAAVVLSGCAVAYFYKKKRKK